jgi:hypothetical protein
MYLGQMHLLSIKEILVLTRWQNRLLIRLRGCWRSSPQYRAKVREVVGVEDGARP